MKKKKIRSITENPSAVQSPNKPTQQLIVASGPLKWTLALSVFVISIFLYGNTFNHGFTLDDPGIINNNKITKAPVSLENTKLIFSTPLRRGQMDIENSLYRPLTKLFFNVEWNVFNGNPAAFHTISVLLYALLGMLIFLILFEALRKNWIVPFLATLLFISHPIHTEVVANVKNSEEILGMLGIMGAIRCIQLYARENKLAWLMLGIISFLAALFSKESSVVAIGLFPLFIYYFTPLDSKRNIKISGMMLACALFFIICRGEVLDGLPQLTLNPLDNLLVLCQNGGERFATAVGLLGIYLQKFLVPFPLSCDYSYASFEPMGFNSPGFLMAGLVLIGLLIYGIRGIKNKNIISFGILWFFISMAISGNIFFLIGTSFAERLLFMPSLGLSLSLVGGVAALTGKIIDNGSLMQSIKASPKIWMVVVPVIIICSAKTIDRNRDWETDIRLFSNDVKNYPNSVHLLFYMGNHPWWAEPREVVDEQFEALGITSAVAKDSSNKESTLVIHYLSKAYSIYPELPAESYFYLGRAYNNMQRYDSAMFFLTKSLTRYSTVKTESYYQLGLAYKNTNNLDSAYRYLSLACQGDPTNSTYLNNLGILYCTMNRPAEALPLFKEAHEHSPEFTDFMNNIGAVYGNLGQTDSAIYWFEKAITANPQNTVALKFLELTWRNRGNLVLADQYKRRAEEAMAGRKGLATY